MSSEANQVEENKNKFNGWSGNATDLTSFNVFEYITLSDGQSVGVQITARHGIDADKMYADFQRFQAFLDMCDQGQFREVSRQTCGYIPIGSEQQRRSQVRACQRRNQRQERIPQRVQGRTFDL